MINTCACAVLIKWLTDNRRAELKVKILTGAYILQANRDRACFNQYAVDPVCKVCSKEPEDREHFIALCEPLDHLREPYRHRFKGLLINITPNVTFDSTLFTRLVLDHTSVLQPDILKAIDSHKVELWSRELLSKLHFERLKLLKNRDTRTAGSGR